MISPILIAVLVMEDIVTPGFVALCMLLGVGLMYWIPIRRWYRYWGATDAEIEQAMLGDAEVPSATYKTTLAVTVDAPTADIWPWLVQMGYRRGGLYSYDWLDRLFGFLDAPSAEHVLPEFQRLEVGDVIPVSRGPSSRRLAVAGADGSRQPSGVVQLRLS